MTRLGDILVRARGDGSGAAFARRLGYSSTFVRAVQKGSRHPSDGVLEDIARKLGLDSEDLAIATYADRSPLLARALRRRGIDSEAAPPSPARRADGGMPRDPSETPCSVGAERVREASA